MSHIFRSVFAIRDICGNASKSIYLKFNFSAPVLSVCSCKCKNSISLSLPSNLKYCTYKNDDENLRLKKLNKKNISDQNRAENEIIYTGPLARNVRSLKTFSLFTSILGVSLQPLIYSKTIASNAASNLTISVCALIGIFALLTPPLIHIITKRYVISVEYNPKEDEYTAVTYNLFVMKKKLIFKPEDVTIPTVLGIFSSCNIKGKPVFLDAASFTNLDHYGRIMGYDKPLDLQTCNNNNDDDDLISKKN